MALFRRSKAAGAGSEPSVQVPDELAQRAQARYGDAEFVAAAEFYSQAVDKLHTMYVAGGCKYRRPSQSDASIAECLVSAVGAAVAQGSSAAVRPLAEQSIGYLSEIAGRPQAKPAADLYEAAISRLSRALS